MYSIHSFQNAFTNQFQYCPRCGAKGMTFVPTHEVQCENTRCRMRFFFNAAAAIGVILCNAAGEVLLIRRAQDPSKDLWDVPGGFVDPGESAEDAVRRETREEVGVTLAQLNYFVSLPNQYVFDGMIYNTLDIFFTATLVPDQPIVLEKNESSAYEWVNLHHVDLDTIAFDALRQALDKYRQQPHG